MFDKLFRKYFVKLHGEGAAHQPDLYRCTVCAALITWNKIKSGNLCCQGHMIPTNPKVKEVVKLFIFPWAV